MIKVKSDRKEKEIGRGQLKSAASSHNTTSNTIVNLASK